jgi:MSHA biogenesis protein MshJ
MKIKASEIPGLVNNLSLRERSSLFGASILLVGGLTYQFLIDPASQGEVQRTTEKVAWTQETNDANQRLFAAQARVTAVQGGITPDMLQTQINERKAAIGAVVADNASLISADALTSAKTLVKSYPQVVLKEMTLQAPQTISLGEGNAKVSLQQHDMLLSVEGSYLDLLAYLQNLEKALPGMRWSELKVEQKKDFTSTVLSVKLSHIQLPADFLKGPK